MILESSQVEAHLASLHGKFPEGCTIVGYDFSNQDIRWMSFRKVMFLACNFYNANLSGCNVEECGFDSCILSRVRMSDSKTKLTSSIFETCKLDDIILCEADMTGVKFVGCTGLDMDWSGANFSRGRAVNCIFSTQKTPLQAQGLFAVDALFDMVNLSGAMFDGSTMITSHFRKCDVDTSLWNSAKLDGIVFQQSDLGHSFFQRAELRSCGFRGIPMWGNNLRSSFVTNCDFTDAALGGAIWTDAEITDCEGID